MSDQERTEGKGNIVLVFTEPHAVTALRKVGDRANLS